MDNLKSPVTCQILLEEKDTESKESEMSSIKGKYVLGSGQKVNLWVVTQYKKKVELQMNIRDKLLDYYNKDVNTKSALVKLRLKSIGTIGIERLIKSNKMNFCGNLLFPKNAIEEDLIEET
ncbi:MAG TPA: hypothetical protein DCF68_09085 [Cyanothece sp. UBA12306]|nr:hypothetical protein [Cyanothece sp. UBA12306]